MNAFDVIFLLLIATAAVAGWRIGFIARFSGWVGIVAGVVVAAWLLPYLLEVLPGAEANQRLFVTIVAFLVGGLGGGAVGEVAGHRLRHAAHRSGLRPLDQLGGAALGLGGIVLLAWLLLPAIAQVPGTVAHQAHHSAIMRVIADRAPQPPDAVQTLRNLIGQTRWPDVFADFGPAPETGPPPEEIPVPPEIVQAATASTVHVTSTGCRARFTGSGFAIEPDVIMTNAHVVAGTEALAIRRPDGTVLDGRVVAFDEDRDLALVAVPGLGQTPLPLARAEAGQDGAVIGYPGGQFEPRVAPVAVEGRRNVTGRDIYRSGTTQRQVLFLAASLRRGDSGAPVIDAGGNVVGVVFAVAPDRASTAYALDEAEVRVLLEAPRAEMVGPCM